MPAGSDDQQRQRRQSKWNPPRIRSHVALFGKAVAAVKEDRMPGVSVVVGGQFGSEGKGKTALEIARRDRNVAAAIRVGGTNSGHTVIGKDGRRYALRQLPAAAVDGSLKV